MELEQQKRAVEVKVSKSFRDSKNWQGAGGHLKAEKTEAAKEVLRNSCVYTKPELAYGRKRKTRKTGSGVERESWGAKRDLDH